MKKSLILLAFLFLAGMVFALSPDLNMVAPEGGTYYSHRTIQIDMNISDADTNAPNLQLDLNYSTSSSEGTGTVIIADVNMTAANGITCDSQNFLTRTVCHYTWTVPTTVASGDYFILGRADIADDSNSDFDATNTAFTFVRLSNSDGLCASVSDDLAVANGCVGDEGVEDGTTSALSLWILSFGDKASLIVFAFALMIFIGLVGLIVFKFRKG